MATWPITIYPDRSDGPEEIIITQGRKTHKGFSLQKTNMPFSVWFLWPRVGQENESRQDLQIRDRVGNAGMNIAELAV